MPSTPVQFLDSVQQALKISKDPLDSTQLHTSLKEVAAHIPTEKALQSTHRLMVPLLASLSSERERAGSLVPRVINSLLKSSNPIERKMAEAVHVLYLKTTLSPHCLKEQILSRKETGLNSYLLKAALLIDANAPPSERLTPTDFLELCLPLLERSYSQREANTVSEHLIEVLSHLTQEGHFFTEEQVYTLMQSALKNPELDSVLVHLYKTQPKLIWSHYLTIFSSLLKRCLAKLDESSYTLLLTFARSVEPLEGFIKRPLPLDVNLMAALMDRKDLTQDLKELGLPLS